MKLYLAGPMTGLPEYNFPAFEMACKQLRANGLVINSPHEIAHEEPDGRGSLDYEVYIRAGLKMLLECTGIIMLPGWELSKGCFTELYVATALGLTIFFYDPERQYLTTSAASRENPNDGE